MATSSRPQTSPALQRARIVDVLLPVALDQSYSYRAPADLALKPGDLVRVPIGAREATGVVWADDVAVRPQPDVVVDASQVEEPCVVVAVG